MKSDVWGVKPCSLVDICLRFGENCTLDGGGIIFLYNVHSFSEAFFAIFRASFFPLWFYSLLDFCCFFCFLSLYTVGRNPWTGDQPVGRPLPT
jgi:hypothetical protein